MAGPRPLTSEDFRVAEKSADIINQVCEKIGKPINAIVADNAEIISDLSKQKLQPRQMMAPRPPKKSLKTEIVEFMTRHPERRFSLRDLCVRFTRSRYHVEQSMNDLAAVRAVIKIKPKSPNGKFLFKINPIYSGK